MASTGQREDALLNGWKIEYIAHPTHHHERDQNWNGSVTKAFGLRSFKFKLWSWLWVWTPHITFHFSCSKTTHLLWQSVKYDWYPPCPMENKKKSKSKGIFIIIPRIDFPTTGAGGLWFQEMGRVTLGLVLVSPDSTIRNTRRLWTWVKHDYQVKASMEKKTKN